MSFYIYCEIFVNDFFNKFGRVEIFILITACFQNNNTPSGCLKKTKTKQKKPATLQKPSNRNS